MCERAGLYSIIFFEGQKPPNFGPQESKLLVYVAIFGLNEIETPEMFSFGDPQKAVQAEEITDIFSCCF